ncbi:unnamed protein product, partial [Pylaiella littoralis]
LNNSGNTAPPSGSSTKVRVAGSSPGPPFKSDIFCTLISLSDRLAVESARRSVGSYKGDSKMTCSTEILHASAFTYFRHERVDKKFSPGLGSLYRCHLGENVYVC